MVVDNNQLTTINELTPLSIYTIRVQAFTNVGPGPLSSPVQVKMQQGGILVCAAPPLSIVKSRQFLPTILPNRYRF